MGKLDKALKLVGLGALAGAAAHGISSEVNAIDLAAQNRVDASKARVLSMGQEEIQELTQQTPVAPMEMGQPSPSMQGSVESLPTATATEQVGADLEINGHGAPFTRYEIAKYYQNDPLHADVCINNPSSPECIALWNKCGTNSQRPPEERSVGCFEGFTVVSPDLPPIINLTGFTAEFPPGVTDPNQVVYRPISGQ